MEVTPLYTFCSEDNGGVGKSRVNGGGRQNATTTMAFSSGDGEDYDVHCIWNCGGGGGGGGNDGETNIERIDVDVNTCGDCICNGGKQQKNGTTTTTGK